MKLVMHPPVDAARLEKITTAAEGMTIVNAPDEAISTFLRSDMDVLVMGPCTIQKPQGKRT